MQDKYKTKAQLMDELAEMRRRIGRMEKALSGCNKSKHAEEAMYRSIFEATGTATTIVEEDMTFSLVNTEFTKLSGYSKEEIESRMKWAEFTIKDDLEEMKRYHHMRRIDPESAPRNYEFRFVDRYGNIKNIFITAAIIPGTKKSVASLQDITERKNAERALQLAEAKFRSLVEQSLVGIYILQDNYYPYANPKCADMFGYTVDEFISAKPVTDFILEDDHPLAREDIRKLLQREVQTVIDTYRGKRKDGTIFELEAQGTLTFYNGNPAIIGTVHDITERKRAEDKLRKIEQQQKAILNNIPDIAWLKDRESKFIAVNESFGEACGVNPENLPGKTDLDIWPKDLAEKYMSDDKEVMETGMMKRVEEQLAGKDGERTWIETIKTPICNHKGEVIGATGIARDITKRKQAEGALVKSEEEFRRLSQEFNILLDAIPDSIILLSPDMKILWANKGAASVLKRKMSKGTGHYCYVLWHDGSGPCDKCAARKCFQTEREESVQISTPDGRLLDSRAFPIKDESGRVVNVILISSDITEKTALQEETMRADRLASLGELAAGVAHEINNPINGIINYAQLLVDISNDGCSEQDIAHQIMEEGDRIANIVRSLLSFARDMKEEKSPVRVHDILNSSLNLIEMQMQIEGIKLKMVIPPNLPEIIAHAQQIQQVFLNIINNARYALNQKYPFVHEEKVIEISGERVTIGDSRFVRIAFYDKGTGIPADKIDKAMNPFFSTKPKGKGTGLGLSISHGIVSDHGGRLVIDSVEGEFTRIVVELAAKEEGE